MNELAAMHSEPVTNSMIATPERSMQICNACRYCENLCAVFPAMTEMREFDTSSLDYLANLCHQCGACFESCQYAPPHPFAVNVKQALNEQRAQSYERVSPSARIWRLSQQFGALSGFALALLFSLILILASMWNGSGSLVSNVGGNFYLHMPHLTMALLGALSFGFGVFGSVYAGWKFRQRSGPTQWSKQAWRGAMHDAATLRYLGDDLCGAERKKWRHWQRYLHHLMTFGFVLCFLSTSLGTLSHYVLGEQAPYPWYSSTALTGISGGILMATGTSGLLLLKLVQPGHGDFATRGMDVSLVLLLWSVAVTGLLLRIVGDSAAMGVMLMLHLGSVFAFFVMLPFSKMIHIPLRLLALVRFHMR